MLDFLKDIRTGKGKKKSLSDMSEIARLEKEKILREKIKELVREEFKDSGFENRIVEIFKSLEKMDKKVENIKSSLVPLSRSKTDSIRKVKMKRMILESIKTNGKMTASDLSVRLDLSRTRCSEYLKELERDGIAKGFIESRRKFYELDNS